MHWLKTLSEIDCTTRSSLAPRKIRLLHDWCPGIARHFLARAEQSSVLFAPWLMIFLVRPVTWMGHPRFPMTERQSCWPIVNRGEPQGTASISGEQHGPVVLTDSTYTTNQSMFDSQYWQEKRGSLSPATRQYTLLNPINRGSLYHCLWASKRSLKISKCGCLLDVLDRLY